jgi:cell division inhibitor SulA/protein ImuA
VNPAIGELLRHPGLWRAAESAAAGDTLSTGFGRLDERTGGGWPRDTLVELLLPSTGIGEFRLLLPALKGLCAAEPGVPRRWVAWIDPPHLPYAPALAGAGLDPAQMLIVRSRGHSLRSFPGGQGQSAFPARAKNEGNVPCSLWAVEQALRSRACAAALAWIEALDDRALRRLKLAAEEGGSLGVICRPLRCARDPSPAALRLALEPSRDGGLDVTVLKGRGSTPGRIEGLL